jgi:hypothetical protein
VVRTEGEARQHAGRTELTGELWIDDPYAADDDLVAGKTLIIVSRQGATDESDGGSDEERCAHDKCAEENESKEEENEEGDERDDAADEEGNPSPARDAGKAGLPAESVGVVELH